MINREFVHQKLQELGPTLLKPNYAKDWTPDNPTLGYCYVVSEALFHYLEEEVHTYCINLGEGIGTHWFVKVKDQIIDFTKEQFSFAVDYSKATRKGFFKGGVQTPTGDISKRGYEMAKHLELI